MLKERLAPGPGAPEGYQVRLDGDLVLLTLLKRTREGNYLILGGTSWEAQWDFESHSISVVEEHFPREVIPVIDKLFGDQLRKLDRPTRQQGLFAGGCSVCGAVEVTFPDTAIRDEFGNIMETRDKQWIAPPEKVQWKCEVCDRLLCRNCALTVDNRGVEFWSHLYCSEACRAAAPTEWLNEDEQIRMT